MLHSAVFPSGPTRSLMRFEALVHMHGLVRQVLCEVQLLLLRSHRAQRQQSLRTDGVRWVRCRGDSTLEPTGPLVRLALQESCTSGTHRIK